ncbi:MAG: hypothetical protein ABI165_13830, partial [Bryobacteraceae bacterium]
MFSNCHESAKSATIRRLYPIPGLYPSKVWICPLLFVLACAATLSAAAPVIARFDPSSMDVGPFPTDALTVADASQKTGLRVNLPLPDCSAQPSTCTELTLLNQLDGFSPNPRVSVRFSGPINADTLRAGMFLVALDNLTNEEYGLQAYGGVVLINQVVYDPGTNTAYAKTDTLIDQHRRYVLVVTDAVEDASGAPVAADPAFTACGMPNEPNSYFQALANAISIAAPIARPHRIIDASVFTTMSATAWLEKAHAAIQNSDPAVLRPSPGAVFPALNIASVTWHQQTGASPAT